MERRALVVARGRTLGDFDVVGGVFSLAGAAIQGGALIGSKLIDADTAKYVANSQRKSDALAVISNERIQLAAIQSQTTQTQVDAQKSTQNVAAVTQALAPGLLALGALGLALALLR